MNRGIAGAADALLAWLCTAASPRRPGVTTAAALLLSLLSAPVLAQSVSATVSPSSFTAEGQQLTFTFNVNSNDSPITGVTFSGVPSPLQNSTCGALTTNGTCTATYTTTEADMQLGGVQVTLNYTMTRPMGGPWSNQVAASPAWVAKAGIPSAPQVVTATSGPRSATLHFLPSNENGGGPITYQVGATPLDGGVPGSAQGTQSPITVTGLSANRRYHLTVNAFNSAGGSLMGGPSNDVFPLPVPPEVNQVEPGKGAQSGGTRVVLVGQYLEGASSVRFGSATGIIRSRSATRLEVDTPAGFGEVDVIVTTADGTSAVNAASKFTYVQPPLVAQITPAAGPLAGGNAVNIVGSLFTDASAVTFGSANASSFIVNSSNSITATVPAGVAGYVDVRVTTPGGTSSAGSQQQRYRYVVAPTLTAIAPNEGPPQGGGTVTITGSGFTGATGVWFGGVMWNAIVDSDTQIRVQTPPGPPGTVDIQVQTPGGHSEVTPAGRYTFVAPPAITGLLPATGPIQGGTSVTIRGTGLSNATAVRFGGTPATGYTFINENEIVATAPAGAEGVVDVTVTTVGGTSAISAHSRYTYSSVPYVVSITRLDPNPTNATSVRFMVRFSEPVMPFGISNFDVVDSGTVTSGLRSVEQTDSTNHVYTLGSLRGAGTLQLKPSASNQIKSVAGVALGGSFDTGEIYTIDTVPPSVVSVGVPPAGHYLASELLDFSVVFDKQIMVSSTPRMPLQIGTRTVYANYVSGSGTPVLQFRYTVSSDDVDADGITLAASLDANGGTLTDALGNNAVLTLNSVGSTRQVLIGRLPQTISLAAQPDVQYLANHSVTINPLATASSGLVVTYSATPTSSSVCQINGNVVTLLGAGECGIAADQPGDAYWQAAPQVIQPLLIVPATQVITGFAATPAVPVYVANGSFTLSALGGASGHPVRFGSTTPAVCTVSGNTVTMLAAGSCTLTADQDGDSNHGAAVQQVLSIRIGAGAQSISGFVATPATPVFVPAGTFSVTANGGASGQPVVFASQSTAVCTVSGSTVTMLAAGTCALTADQAGDARYAPSPQQRLNVAIGVADQTIIDFVAAPALPVFVPNGSFTVSARGGTSGEPVLFGSTSPLVCTVAGNTVTMLSAGTCALTADQAGNASHAAATQKTLNVAIGVATQTITGFTTTQAVPVFEPNGSFSVSAVGGASGEPLQFGSSSPGICTVSGSTVTMLAAGTCALTVDQAGNANYAAATQQTLDVLIGAGVQTIIGFAANPAAPVFTPNGSFSVNATGGGSGQPVLFASQSTAVCTVSGSTVTMLAGGTCVLTADQAAGGSYAAAAQQQLDVLIGSATQAITAFVANPAAPVFAVDGSFSVSANGGASGQPVVFGTTSPAVCTVTGNTVTLLSAGTCALTADQAGNASYAAAPQQTLDVVVAAAEQRITGFVATPETPVYVANGSFSVAAKGGDSTAPVVFGSSTPQVCTVSGTTVTMLAAGRCTLTADQAADANHAAAPQLQLEVIIGKATPILSWVADMSRLLSSAAFDLEDPDSTLPGQFTFSSSNTQVATLNGRTVSIVGPGITTLTATLAASGNHVGATISLQLSVDDRPDPTLDASVAAGVQAQLDASVRFVQAQQDNIRGRLGQLRQGRNASSNGMALSMQGGMNQPGLSLRADQVGAKTPALAPGWGLWSAGTIIQGERDARGAREGFSFRSDGLSLGVDRVVSESLVLGAAAGMGWNDTDFDTSGSAQDATQRSLALYGVWHARRWFIDGLLGWGQLDFDLKRRSALLDATATGSRKGDQQFASLTLGYDHVGEVSTLTGYGRVDASRTDLDAYRERGLGNYDLQYAKQRVQSSTAAVGVEGRYSLRTANAMLRPSWTLEWRQALRNSGDAGLDYVNAPRDSSYVLGVRSYNDDLLAAGAGLDVVFDNGWNLSFLYRREQARDVFSNSFGVRIGYGRALAPISAEQAWFQANGLTRPMVEPTKGATP